MTEIPPNCPQGDACPLVEEVARLKQEIAELSELVSTDNLTSLYNFHHFNKIIGQELERSQRTAQPTSLIMLDADHFKSVNDQWGHETGNQALKLIASCIEHNVRKLDVACRYGGEEFAIILPSTDIATATMVAERIREAVEQTLFVVNQQSQETAKLTISLGVSCSFGQGVGNWQKLVEIADKELYRAKESGRNQVCTSVEEISEQQVTEDEKGALFDIFK